MRITTKMITEGAILCALCGVIQFINIYFSSMLDLIIMWILAYPIMIYVIRYNMKAGYMFLVSSVLLSCMIAPLPSTIYLILAEVIGLLYGFGVRKNWHNKILLIVTTILTAVSYVLTTIVFAGFFGYDLDSDLEMIHNIFSLFHMGDSTQLQYTILIISTLLMSYIQSLCVQLGANILMIRLRIQKK